MHARVLAVAVSTPELTEHQHYRGWGPEKCMRRSFGLEISITMIQPSILASAPLAARVASPFLTLILYVPFSPILLSALSFFCD